MLIYVKKKNFLRTNGRTDGQPKTIVRNLTKYDEIIYMYSDRTDILDLESLQ